MPSDVGIQYIIDPISNPIGGSTKRIFDFVFSVFALLGLLPIFLVIIFIHKCVGKGPVFFAHERVGLRGNTFMCLKFRTMVVDADKRLEELLASDPEARAEFARDSKLKNDPRILPIIGEFMRKTSLDEIPQFWNVIRGDMSVVGPRPVTRREFADYKSARGHYARTRPGVTGLWQVSGRNDMDFDERVEIDRGYVGNWSFVTDLMIVAKTVKVVLNREGAY